MEIDELKKLVAWHRRVGAEERRAQDQAQQAFEGRLKEAFSDEIPSEMFADNLLAAPNLIAKTVRSIATALTYNNPAIYVKPDDPDSVRLQATLTGALTKALKSVNFNAQLKLATIRALTMKRSGWKLGWNSAADMITMSVVDPRCVYFDPQSTWDKVTYYAELVEMPEKVWKKKVASGLYKDVKIDFTAPTKEMTVDLAKTDAYPRRVVYVWEFYDLEEMMVYHWADKAEEFVLVEPLSYCPYVMFSLDSNGVDCRGSSEADRIRRQQKNAVMISAVLTKVLSKSVPGMIGDSGALDDDDRTAIDDMGPGDNVWVQRKDKDQTRSLRDILVPTQAPVVPPIFGQIMSMAEGDATDDARYSEIRAGKPGGYRSATEATIADTNTRSLVGDKESSLNEACTRLGDLILYLLGRYRNAPIFVEPEGQPKRAPKLDAQGRPVSEAPTWAMITREMIRKAHYYCEIGLFNPARRNPDVYAEMLLQNMATFLQLPEVRRASFLRHFVQTIGMPPEDIKTEEEMAQEAEAAAAAAAGPAPTPPGGAGAGAEMDPAAMLAAMGGAGGGVGAGGPSPLAPPVLAPSEMVPPGPAPAGP